MDAYVGLSRGDAFYTKDQTLLHVVTNKGLVTICNCFLGAEQTMSDFLAQLYNLTIYVEIWPDLSTPDLDF
jgi:hypothetical protein